MQGLALRIPQHGAPAVVAGRQTFTQRDRHDRWTTLPGDAFRRRAVAADVERSGGDVRALDRHAKHRLQILFVRDHHVDVAHERPHRGLRLGFRPQFSAIVEIDAHARACALRPRNQGCIGA